MPKNAHRLSLSMFLCLLAVNYSGWSEDVVEALEVSAMFSDHMVVQRDTPIRVWGKAGPGQSVTGKLHDSESTTKADTEGRWLLEFPAMAAGGPYTIEIAGEQHLTLRDVWVGDVWLCSGQSNMAWPVQSGTMDVSNANEEVAAASYPLIRLMTVTQTRSLHPLDEPDTAGWTVCSPDTVGPFSAVGYFFGREIHLATGVPVGLINSSVGGTAIEAWMSREGLRTVPATATYLDALDSTSGLRDQLRRDHDLAFESWMTRLNEADAGFNDDGKPAWAAPDLDVSDWKTIVMPQLWEDGDYPDLDGVMWFRKNLAFESSAKGKALHLGLGPVSDRLQLWFNGVEIVKWATSAQPARGYEIPASLVQEGENTIAFRLYDMGGKGGLSGKPADMWLKSDDASVQMDLSGPWLCKPGLAFKEFPPMPRVTMHHPDSASHPAVLYNGMIAPLSKFPICGVIWYQGEANASRAEEYRALLPALIRDWRNQWHRGDWAFLVVQLANYREVQERPGDSDWAELREAQAMALSTPKTAMAVTIDLGEAEDIHPRNKQDVGKRLALAARKLVYGHNVEASGPTFLRAAKEDHKFRLTFDHVGTGLTAKEETVKGFAIAGPDRHFEWAEARIEGDAVVVWNDSIPDPVAVRYAWADNPVCNLYNGNGLPAVPFRTDDWPGMTHGKSLTLPRP